MVWVRERGKCGNNVWCNSNYFFSHSLHLIPQHVAGTCARVQRGWQTWIRRGDLHFFFLEYTLCCCFPLLSWSLQPFTVIHYPHHKDSRILCIVQCVAATQKKDFRLFGVLEEFTLDEGVICFQFRMKIFKWKKSKQFENRENFNIVEFLNIVFEVKHFY